MGSELRIDRWLWFTRFYRTRTLAMRAVAAGHVRVNGQRARPGLRVRPGDRIDLVRGQLPYSLVVASVPSRRGPAADAQTCYDEVDDVRLRRHALREVLKSDRRLMARTDGRPDQRTRRLLRQRNRGD